MWRTAILMMVLAGCTSILGGRESSRTSDADVGGDRDAPASRDGGRDAPGDARMIDGRMIDGGPQAFIKHGNDGTVSCATYCGAPQFGTPTTCLGTFINDFPCDQATGTLANAIELECTCFDGTDYVKAGDNGDAPCNQYCAGSQYGRVGNCVSAAIQPNAAVEIGGQTVPYDADCTIKPGYIDNAAELSCICE